MISANLDVQCQCNMNQTFYISHLFPPCCGNLFDKGSLEKDAFILVHSLKAQPIMLDNSRSRSLSSWECCIHSQEAKRRECWAGVQFVLLKRSAECNRWTWRPVRGLQPSLEVPSTPQGKLRGMLSGEENERP